MAPADPGPWRLPSSLARLARGWTHAGMVRAGACGCVYNLLRLSQVATFSGAAVSASVRGWCAGCRPGDRAAPGTDSGAPLFVSAQHGAAASAGKLDSPLAWSEERAARPP